MTNKATCMFGFTAGCAVGAMVGLLYAPRPGSETRQQIGEAAERTRDKLHSAQEYGTEVADKVKHAGSWIKNRASTVVEKAQHLRGSRPERELASVSGDNDNTPPRFID